MDAHIFLVGKKIILKNDSFPQFSTYLGIPLQKNSAGFDAIHSSCHFLIFSKLEIPWPERPTATSGNMMDQPARVRRVR